MVGAKANLRKRKPMLFAFFVCISVLFGSHGDRVLCIPLDAGTGSIDYSSRTYSCYESTSHYNELSAKKKVCPHRVCIDLEVPGDALIASENPSLKFSDEIDKPNLHFKHNSSDPIGFHALQVNTLGQYLNSKAFLEIRANLLVRNVKKIVLLI